MKPRRIGRTGLSAAAVGIGTLALAGCYGPVTDAEGDRTIRSALDNDTPLIDMAAHYAGGRVERLVGRAVAGRRDDVVIATRHREPAGRNLRTASRSVRAACDASLRRLGVEHIDLYFVHPDPRVPIEDTVGHVAELEELGKVRFTGLSGVSRDQLYRAHQVHPIAALAAEYSLWERRVEREILGAALELGIGVVACRPLGRGFLTGRVSSIRSLGPNDSRRDDPRFESANLRHNLRLLPAVEAHVTRRHVGLTRIALAWLLARGENIVPVPSTRNPLHREMNSSAADLRLSPAECDRLAALFPPRSIAGRPPPLWSD
jgi:aryl-alcohol dehydrogenase-like predicted oxidoreductase